MTKRPISEGAEKLLDLYFPVLDHGFIALKDYCGSDAAIAQAARCSYGAGTKTINDDKNLIRYLVRHLHTSPLEQVELKFHVKMPIFVARQWIRHRSACLASDVQLWFDEPAALLKNKRKRRAMSIGEFFKKWQTPSLRKRLSSMNLRSLNEDDSIIGITNITDIWSNGEKDVFKVTLENGYSIKMTKDHLCYTENGWKTLKEASGLSISRDGNVSWKGDSPKFWTNGTYSYRSFEWMSEQRKKGFCVTQIAEEAGVSYHTIRKWLRIHGLQFSPKEIAKFSSQTQNYTPRHLNKKLPYVKRLSPQLFKIKNIEYIGKEEVFDISVSGPFHNFIANGFVVHNSLNEISGRYSIMPLQFYSPKFEDFKYQSIDNKQGRGDLARRDHYIENRIRSDTSRALVKENYMIDLGNDVARELARIDLPLSTYTEMYWKMDLHNLMHFLRLRCDGHAQYEIREYANIIAGIVKEVVPLSYDAWMDYTFTSVKFSYQEMKALIALGIELGTSGSDEGGGFDACIPKETQWADWGKKFGLSKRETIEFFGKLNLKEQPDYTLDFSKAKSSEYFREETERYVPEIIQNTK
jgi:thymidylate synthase ThyX/phage antirepressor YoqD-like protein